MTGSKGMANEEHLDLLTTWTSTGDRWKSVWRKWKIDHPTIEVDLTNADFHGVNLKGIDLKRADLSNANLSGADLSEANLEWADLSQADLSEAYLYLASLLQANLSKAYLFGARLFEANLYKADLSQATLLKADLSGAFLFEANLSEANLSRANLYKADLRGANLTRARLYEANLSNPNLSRANLTGCYIYATSAWNGELKDAIQLGLIITTPGESDITIDNFEVAQFIYLLLNNEKVRDVIDTVTSKVVLILGRFMNERKKILNALRMTGLRVSKNHSLSSVTVS